MKQLLYIHGFNSGSQSFKAEQLRLWVASQNYPVELITPTLPDLPTDAIQCLESLLPFEQKPDVGIIGSSLGGYYAAYLSERYGCKAVLINPAMKPYNLLQQYRGEITNPQTGRTYHVGQRHLEQLKSIDVPVMSKPKNILLLVETGDETLDYSESVEKLQGANARIIDGGSHIFEHFNVMIPDMMQFLFPR
ncbi:MAG: esterase [Methylococcales bacterium]|nr:esterase [Methylococcales bacterium]